MVRTQLKEKNPRPVAIIGGVRIPFTKSFAEYDGVSNQEMLTHVVSHLVQKFHLVGETIGDVATGSVMTHPTDWNLSREVVLSSGLSPHTPGFNVQRACGTSLDTSNLISLKIAMGQIECGIAGGTDTNSDLPVAVGKEFARRLIASGRARSLGDRIKAFSGFKFAHLKPVLPGVVEPRTHLSMGQHTELMAKAWSISRMAQDELALMSHRNAASAYEKGFYDDLIVPFKGLTKDTIVRSDTSLDKLSKLKPAFDKSEAGTLTAGNSSALTDGAAAVLLASEEYAKQRNWPVLAYLRDVEVAAVDFVSGQEGLLIAPVYAVSRLLDRNGLTLQDFDLYEIHEAFAAQVLCTLSAWESEEYCRTKLGKTKALGPIDRNKMNINGGSVAMGHPFAATGARIVATLAKELHQRGGGRGLISICTAGGMGVAAIVES